MPTISTIATESHYFAEVATMRRHSVMCWNPDFLPEKNSFGVGNFQVVNFPEVNRPPRGGEAVSKTLVSVSLSLIMSTDCSNIIVTILCKYLMTSV